MKRRLQQIGFLVGALLLTLPAQGLAQAPAQTTPAALAALAAEAAQHQLADAHHTTWGLRYRVHRVDDKEDSIRELIETPDGVVSRTLTYKGRPLNADEEKGELERLRALTPEEVRRKQQRSEATDKYGTELVKTFPRAMTFTLAPGQPQLPVETRPQIVLDYTPSASFHPTSTVQSLLTGVAGRVWIDAESHHLTRIDVHITRNLNLMFGILARVYEGGFVSYEQRPVANGHDAYTNIRMDVKLRELMFHVAPYKQTLTVSGVRFLPVAPTVQEAVQELVNLQAATVLSASAAR